MDLLDDNDVSTHSHSLSIRSTSLYIVDAANTLKRISRETMSITMLGARTITCATPTSRGFEFYITTDPSAYPYTSNPMSEPYRIHHVVAHDFYAKEESAALEKRQKRLRLSLPSDKDFNRIMINCSVDAQVTETSLVRSCQYITENGSGHHYNGPLVPPRSRGRI